MERIGIPDLDQEDLEALSRAREAQLGGVSPGSLADKVTRGEAQMWRIVGSQGRGIIITQIFPRQEGRELLVWLMGGQGLRPYMQEMIEKLSEYGQLHECRWLTGLSKPAVARVLEREGGFRKEYIQVVKEI